jgi:hypothetical protein
MGIGIAYKGRKAPLLQFLVMPHQYQFFFRERRKQEAKMIG